MIRRGGISLIRVTDDGIGMDRDDALLCLERHATSKIRTAADLAAVGTLGFRGEALPSIASVSRFRLTTREKEAVAGTEVIVSGGRIETVRDGGEAPGTQVEVRSLFYNLPARRKFLRSENTETRNIEHQLNLQAIASSRRSPFRFVRDERVVFQLPATKTLRDRIRDLLGSELLARLLEVEPATRGKVRVSGFIGQAGVSRASRAQQFVFVNGRAVESPVIGAALKEGYHTALMKGQFPVTFLFRRARSGGSGCQCAPGETRSAFSRSGRGARSGRGGDPADPGERPEQLAGAISRAGRSRRCAVRQADAEPIDAVQRRRPAADFPVETATTAGSRLAVFA